MAPIRVVFLPRQDASITDITQWHGQQSHLAHTWWHSIFISAVNSLPIHTRTRRHNTTATFIETDTSPTYLRVYSEDVPSLDIAIEAACSTSALSTDLEWYFLCRRCGQRQLLDEGEPLDPSAFGLGSMVDLSKCVRFTAHLAFSLRCTDDAFSLFWNAKNTSKWSSRTGELLCFG